MTTKIDWVKIMEENREAIEEKILQAKKETFETMSGWHVDVEMNEQGEVWTGDMMSTGSQSMSSYKGETFIITSVKSWRTECNLDVEQEMKYNDNQKYFNEYKTQQEEDIINESAYDFMYENYPEILKQWEEEQEEAEKDEEINELDTGEILDRAIEEERAYHQFD